MTTLLPQLSKTCKLSLKSTRLVFKRKLHRKLSYYHQVGKEPLIPVTLGTLLEKAVGKYEDREAIKVIHQNRTLTYKEVLNECDKLAAALKDVGLERGDRVGIWATNILEWYITMFACARAGVILVTINPAYQPPELEYCINKVGIKTLISQDKDKYKDYYDFLTDIAPSIRSSEPGKINDPKLPSLKSVIVTGSEERKGAFNYNEFVNRPSKQSVNAIKNNQHLIDPDEGFNIQFTSGTTGFPKAALVNHFTMVNNSLQIALRANILNKHHRICIQAPFFHALGTVVSLPTALHAGATLVVPSPTFKPHAVLDAIKNEKCSVITGTPTMYIDLVRAQEERQENISLDLAITGGAPCSPRLFEEMRNVLNVQKQQSVYGLTELTAVAFQSLVNDDKETVLTTVGCVGDHLEVKVIDDTGKIVPCGTPGELCVRGYSCMLGYWGDEEKTKEMMGPDRWLKTGDVFILEESGYGKIVSRKKDVIIRGGEKIFPKEIEDFLTAHPDIVECYVVGVPDERLGEEVVACLRMKNGTVVSELDIAQFCKGKISHYKIPKKVKIVDDFPKTGSGKVQKFKLQEQFAAAC
ncbi:acyl-CoA synthetase family member 2, mitochondrial [Agrilus planipennis]|uniref:Medium-chain acyl-CoA ligase ACSF2, mitochondrial n=1 Tax=Agrilus planipennis TaxID=224129 RepID=A0A1W4XQG6_AGRPL|nr:acyl-CoA synthetase family member 2, mitochondrial [Agrilus planipennis]